MCLEWCTPKKTTTIFQFREKPPRKIKYAWTRARAPSPPAPSERIALCSYSYLGGTYDFFLLCIRKIYKSAVHENALLGSSVAGQLVASTKLNSQFHCLTLCIIPAFLFIYAVRMIKKPNEPSPESSKQLQTTESVKYSFGNVAGVTNLECDVKLCEQI